MNERKLQIAIFGTFDVENFGDLLFPLVAESELSRRLGAVAIHAFSYRARSPPDWPYPVTAIADFPRLAADMDGVLIGGGFIVRFDKDVADGYGPSTPAVHHPTGYWLTPGLIALQHGIPLIWNAPGMHCNEVPSWADALMRLVLSQGRYIAVRDRLSRAALEPLAGGASIEVVPDTGFGISRVIEALDPSDALRAVREAAGLTGPYIVVQAVGGLDPFVSFVKAHDERLRDYSFLVLPIGPVLGDRESILTGELPRAVTLPSWPDPLMIARLIGGADAVVGQSYHLAITALAAGVPVFQSADLAHGKFTALARFDTVYPLPAGAGDDPERFIARLGRSLPSQETHAALAQLTHHWDRIAAILREGPTATAAAMNTFWQALPGLLENGSLPSDAREAEYAQAEEAFVEELNALDGELSRLKARLAESGPRVERGVRVTGQDARTW